MYPQHIILVLFFNEKIRDFLLDPGFFFVGSKDILYFFIFERGHQYFLFNNGKQSILERERERDSTRACYDL
jgi:hypothetical protein